MAFMKGGGKRHASLRSKAGQCSVDSSSLQRDLDPHLGTDVLGFFGLLLLRELAGGGVGARSDSSDLERLEGADGSRGGDAQHG